MKSSLNGPGISPQFLVMPNDWRYPPTARRPVTEDHHGVKLTDHYRWLENYRDPEVAAWLEAQEQLTARHIDKLPAQPAILNRLTEVMDLDDESVPLECIASPRVFYYAKLKNDEKARFRTREHLDAEVVELLNPNEWDHARTLDFCKASPDGAYLAYGCSEGGSESPVIRVLETATRREIPVELRGWRHHDVAWTPDNKGFYYSASPCKGEVPDGEEYYWWKVFYHELGTSADQDREIFGHDSVKEYMHSAMVSEDGQYLVLQRSHRYECELFLARIGSADAPVPVVTGLDAAYSAEIHNDKLFITTNKDAPKKKVYWADTANPGRDHWRELIPECDDNLEGVSFVAGKVFAHYLHKAYMLIKIFTPQGEYLDSLPLPTMGSASVYGRWAKPTVWVSFTSFVYPNIRYTFDLTTWKLKLYRQPPIDLNPEQFEVHQVEYPSQDGVMITMFLVHKKGLSLNSENPLMLTGYGGFTISMSPYFTAPNLLWLEAGGVVALPNLRGGGEYGEAWHQAGMFEKKQNVFNDFIAAAEWLIRQKYTKPSRMIIKGGSNGGLLVGAVAVQRPDLFTAVLCAVPLLDMIRYHKFTFANIWASEYGSPDDPEQFKYILDYSPYHNIRLGRRYPVMLIVAAENDVRVPPLHAMKMIARLQEADSQGGPFLLHVQRTSGHTGSTLLSQEIEHLSKEIAFLMDQVGLVFEKRS